MHELSFSHGDIPQMPIETETYLSLYVSGSAYKIVTKRSYHHGTMLLSTELDTLGNVLRPQKENIVTKGVDSVRSPVCNLKRHNSTITHESFTSAVVEQFQAEYGVSSEPCLVSESEDVKNIEFIKQGMAELSTWDWLFGQTPQFTHTLRHTFAWGDVTIRIESKHGLIVNCTLTISNTQLPGDAVASLGAFAERFYQGQKYGFIDDIGDAEEHGLINDQAVSSLAQEVHALVQDKINLHQR
ncbi:hypothetical protein D9613_004797 [Agrocybe pediades]|uniref:Putative lipoate-protein ligase A n=1 Tax=Agrocybe pediades TaxID=84607 RepID=A0A8H4VR92_9AGAR|nr:hypothetical protein D9613_004797 [Agrocybe pediades]